MTALGIDIGGTRIKAGLVDESGTILERHSEPTPAALEEFREVLGGLVARLSPAGPAGIGIGCKGVIDPGTTRIETLPGELRYLEGHRLSELIAFDGPVHADNDARVAMAGEMLWGAARGRRNALMLTLGTGVGGAVVAEGKLLRGAGGVAGHVGHLTVVPDGPPCICGNHGCLETYFSARAIEAEAWRIVHAGCDSLLTRRFGSGQEEIACEAVFAAAVAGDAIAGEILDRAIHALGAAIAGLVLVLDPEVIIVGGRISEAGAALFDPLEREIARRTGGLLRRRVPLVPPQMAGRTGVAGAAALVLSEAR